MPLSTKFLAPALAASLLLAACGSSSSTSATSAAPSKPVSQTGGGPSTGTVKTARNAKLGGTILVAANGMTLYRLSGEQNGKWICTSAACVKTWPPLAPPASGNVASLGTTKRPDGTMQVTYKGMPLYTFAHDQRPGDVNGQGIKDVGTWNAVTTSAAKSNSQPSSNRPAPSGGGYTY
jgi:predicted lipoprotein with Yx(FWY)xxD motif